MLSAVLACVLSRAVLDSDVILLRKFVPLTSVRDRRSVHRSLESGSGVQRQAGCAEPIGCDRQPAVRRFCAAAPILERCFAGA